MTSVQGTLNFPIRKKSSFYSTKDSTPKIDYTNATLRETNTKYTPTVKKIVTFSSSESSESDSDSENLIDRKNKFQNKNKDISSTPRRIRKSSGSEDEGGSTPPKQKKILPATTTPSTLFDRLQLKSPEGKDQMTPKRLFQAEKGKYQDARKALHSAAPENMPGRENELEELEKIITKHLTEKTSGSIYVSGPPGTGKTATLSKVILKPELKSALKIVYVNCTTMKSAGSIYTRIIEELNIPAPKLMKNSKDVIEKYLMTKHKTILLILDEMDQLDSRRQTVLYSIFDWPSLQNAKLILVGIANALDLTDRILPRLQVRCELKPKLMHFASYNKQQIVDIITKRLEEANVSDIFTGMAIQMLAGKVAAISGDVRRALDISRRVVEIAETKKFNQVLQPAIDNATNGGSPKKQQPVGEKPVDLKEVMTILNGVYGGTQNMYKDEDNFPLQQKLILCSLMLILNKGRNKDVTIGRLHAVYKKVCKKRNIHAIDESELVSTSSLIETRGILRIVRKKEPRMFKVDLQWDQQELEAALQDKRMMAEIINDSSCL